MRKVCVCIPTLSERASFLEELFISLDNQTFRDFSTILVSDVSPVGKAKHDLINLALSDNPEYILMIDDDDYIFPDYISRVVERLEKGDIDWCFTWGFLFGDDNRKGYIHGKIQTPDEMRLWNEHPAWISAKAEVFRDFNYNPEMDYAEDMDLWLRILESPYKGDVIKDELYMKRWHKNSLMGMRAEY